MYRFFVGLWIFVMASRAFAGGGITLPADYDLESRFHYGFIWPHHNSIRYLQRGHIPAFDLRMSRSISDKNWASLYRYPDLGLGFYHANLQWDDVLGKINACYGFIKSPIIRKKRFKLNYSFAFGIAFISRHFDIDDNYFNIAIGSTSNVYLNFGLESQFSINDHLFAFLGADLSHVSNGAIKKPNLGLNLPALNIGVKYAINPPKNLLDPILKTSYRPTFNIFIIASSGWKEILPPGGKTYLTSSLWIEAGRMITRRKRIGLGLDLFYDGSILKRMENNEIEESSKIKNLRQGAHVSYDLIYGNIVFTMQVGYYFLVDWNDDGNMFNRFGLRYHHHKVVYNISIKTHMGRADFIEWGIGYQLFKR